MFFGNNEVRINCVDFCHDSAITKQALMALTAPKIENLRNFEEGRVEVVMFFA